MPAATAENYEKGLPDIKVSVRQTFGLDSDMVVPGFSATSEHVPVLDENYRFDPVCLSPLLGTNR